MRGRTLASPIAVLVLMTFVCLACRGSFLALAAYESSAKIEAADAAVREAFDSILAAEKVGGDISGLMSELDGAGRLLAEANNAYRSGDLNGAQSKAENATLIADSVKSAALELKNIAARQGQNAFWLTVAFSMAGSVALVNVLILVWSRFKRRYAKRLSGMKPEVAANA